MKKTPRNQWPYPSFQQDPWYDAFESFARSIDATVFTIREDRNTVLSGGGTVSFNAISGELSWSASLSLNVCSTGFQWSVLPGSAVLEPGEGLYLLVVRNPSGNLNLTPTVSVSAPVSDDSLLLCIRLGNRIHFRDGQVLNDGDSVAVFETTTGGGSSVSSLADVLALGNETGGNPIVVSAGDDVRSPVGEDLLLQSLPDAGSVGTGDAILRAGDSASGPPGRVTIQAGSCLSNDYGGGNVSIIAGSGDDVSEIGMYNAPVYIDESLIVHETLQVTGLSTLQGGASISTSCSAPHVTMPHGAAPTTIASQGSFFVSDGSGGLNVGSPYFRPQSDGVPIELGGGGGAAFYERTVAQNENVDGLEALKALGAFQFDPADYYGVITQVQLRVVMSCSNAGETATFRLYNLTDSEYVTGAEVSTSSTTPALLTAVMDIGTDPGDLKTTGKIYEPRIVQSGAVVTDVTYLGSAVFRIREVV